MSADEQAQVQRAIAGDADALAALLEHAAAVVRPTIERAIPRRLRSLLSADDVLQQTFTDAFLSIRSFAPVGNGAFTAWVTAIARRNVIDAVRYLDAERRGGRAETVPLGQSRASWPSQALRLARGNTSPAGGARRNEAAQALRSAVARLPADYQTVIRMYDLEGRAMADVASAIGRTRGAAYLIRQRGLARLEQLLGPSGDFFSTGA